MSLSKLNADYQSAQRLYWTGRKSNPDIGKQYWYQEVDLLDISEFEEASAKKKIDIALIGYVCDEGVRRNLGRVGAQQGPRVLRERLAKLPIHFEEKRVVDVGDIICLEEDMEACQQEFSNMITQVVKNNTFPIAIGGGHDMAYGHFRGLWNVIKDTPKKKIGIINFDAHFDLRPIETKPNSGTPFNQILNEQKNRG